MSGSSFTPTVSSSTPRRERAESPSVWQACSPSLSLGGLSSESKPQEHHSTPRHRRESLISWKETGAISPILYTSFISVEMVSALHSDQLWICRKDENKDYTWSSPKNHEVLSSPCYLCQLPPNIKPRSREFITNQPLTPFPMPPPKPSSNCLHPVIRQINGRAWNVAFTSTKVKCCREGGAGWLWRVDYALRNPLNASIIWWSCQFAVCALSLPHLLPPPPNQSRLCCNTSEEDLKFREAEIHVGRRDKQPQMLPGIPTSLKLKITVLMSWQNLCHVWIYIIWVKGTTGAYGKSETW